MIIKLFVFKMTLKIKKCFGKNNAIKHTSALNVFEFYLIVILSFAVTSGMIFYLSLYLIETPFYGNFANRVDLIQTAHVRGV